MRSDVHVCFVSPSAYPLFDPTIDSAFGGSEVRSWYFGTRLAKRAGYRVSFVVLDHGQGPARDFGGVTVYAHSCYRGTGYVPPPEPVSGLWPRVRSRFGFASRKRTIHIGDHAIGPEKLRILRSVDADIYGAFGVGNGTADVVAFCLGAGKKCVLFAGSGGDFAASYREDSVEYNDYGSRGDACYYVIRHANAVVTQNEEQQQLLRERFGREGTLIRNPFDFASLDPATPERADTFPVLWVGKSDGVKRPQDLIALAKLCPSIPFLMVMNRANPEIFANVASSLPGNVRLVERVAFAEMDRLFREARMLVNTSVFEGFPNTFLQAAAHAMPIVSLGVDPDRFIARSGCGRVAGGDLGLLARQIDEIWRNRALRDELGRKGKTYAVQRHGIEARVDELDAFLRRLAASA
jgi:glycosyltransferase involved in cell wall biosynthesis